MSRIETIGDATLYLGDCLEILPTIPYAVLPLTDPPYGIDYQSARRTDKTQWHPKIANDTNLDFMPAVLAELFRMTPEYAHAYIFCRWDKWPLPWGEWKASNMLVWDKLQHGTGDLENSFGPQHELCAFLTKGRRGFNGKRPVDVLRCPKVPPEQLVHSCEKPVALLQRLVELSSDHGGIVIDPFMGSGATGQAAMRAGRKFIGIEIDEKYFDISCRRIEDAQRQGDMFQQANSQ